MKPAKTFTINKAQFEDMKKIAKFINSSAEWYRPIVAPKDMKEHCVDEKWMKKNYDMRDFYIGTDEKSNDVGTISLQFFGKQTYLGYIYLDAKHVGNGHGKRLMDFAKYMSEKKGQESMILIAHPEAHWAVKAYEKYGFKRKFKEKEDILDYKDGLMKPYYEEGFHLYEYKID